MSGISGTLRIWHRGEIGGLDVPHPDRNAVMIDVRGQSCDIAHLLDAFTNGAILPQRFRPQLDRSPTVHSETESAVNSFVMDGRL